MENIPVLYNGLKSYIQGLQTSTISTERKEALQPLADFIKQKASQNQPILLNFICTHNSRRSHLAQVWAQTMAAYYNIPKVVCYSGGTEATALFPMVAQVLKNTGFEVSSETKSNNPVYNIKYSEMAPPIKGFSKKYDDPFNPKSGFAAILTCSEADKGCPFIAGAEKRVALPYNDPKVSDGTPQQEETYAERSRQIATELKYVFSKIDV